LDQKPLVAAMHLKIQVSLSLSSCQVWHRGGLKNYIIFGKNGFLASCSLMGIFFV
jgi:hypothetical protein